MEKWLIFAAAVAIVGVIVYKRATGGVFSVPSDVLPGEPDYSPGTDPEGLFMRAIAIAEGSDPTWKNPGDLTDSFGFPTVGVANSAGVLKFDTMNHGWGALRAQVDLITNGGSRNYSLGMSIQQMAVKYTGNDQASSWAANVATELGVDPSTSLGSVLGANS